MNLFRKRIIAGLLTAAMLVSSLQVSALDVYAQETAEGISAAESLFENEDEISAAEEGEAEAVSENNEEADSDIITVEAEFKGVYQFGDAPSAEASESAEPSWSIESDNPVEDVDGMSVDEYIYQEALKRNPAINISSYNINVGNIESLVAGVLNENPDLYFVVGGWGYSYSGSIVTTVRLNYSDDEDLDDEAFKKETKAALSLIDDSMSDLQKIIILHDYLAVNCEYDEENLLADTIPPMSYKSYGALVNRMAVCQGYALAYKYLLNKAGIECYMVESKSMNHAWNLVKLDGEFYQVDVTWDDPIWDRIGRARHLYMLLSDAAFETAGSGHSGWYVTKGAEVVDYKAVDTKYDNAFWSGADAPLVLAGDDWNDCYYTYYDAGSVSGKIYKTTLSNDNVTDIGREFCDIGRWTVWGKTSYYTNVFSGLFTANNRLYFNDKTSIYSIAFDGTDKKTEFTADTTDGYIYGSALCKGKVVYSLRQDPNFKGKETVLETDIEIQDEKQDEEPPSPHVELVMNLETLEMAVIENTILYVTVTANDGTKPDITWESSDSSIAEIELFPDSDTSIRVKGVSEGECTITASAGDAKAVCNVTVTAAAGSYQDTTWEIDKDGKLTVNGTGEMKPFGDSYIAPWYEYNSYIKSAEINVTGATDLSSMFFYCSSLRSVDMSNFSTSQVTSMTNMFYGCKNLTNLDLPTLDISQVESMSYLFYNCSSLESLDLSMLKTGNVKSINGMFSGCSNLKSLDLSNFDMGSVENAEGMFDKCDSLNKIKSPLNLKLSVSLPVNTSEMWIAPEKEQFTELPRNSSESIELNKYIGGTYENIFWTIDADGKLVVEGTGEFASSATSASAGRAPWYNYRGKIKSAEVKVTGMTDAAHMFNSCSAMESLDLSNFDMAEVAGVFAMLIGCSSLKKINTPCNLSLDITLPAKSNEAWYNPEGERVTSLPKDLSYSIELTKELVDIAKGTYGGITWVINSDGKLIVEGTGEILNPDDNNRTPWHSYEIDIKSVEINVTGTTNAHALLARLYNMESVDLSGFDTSQVTDMSEMFFACYGMTSADLSGLNTSQVTDMSSMFSGCDSLESVNLGDSFNTSQVADMSNMFSGCHGSMIETFLDIMNTANVTNISGIFSDCLSIENMDYLRKMDTSRVTDMSSVFSGCTNLAAMDFGGIDTQNVTTMAYMFGGCSSLPAIDLTKADLKNVTNISGMFQSCRGLTSVDSKDVDISRMTEVNGLFYDCINLEEADFSGVKVESADLIDMRKMFSACSNLKEVDFSNIEIPNAAMGNMFFNCANLEKADFSNAHIDDAVMSSMFYNCIELTTIDFNGAKIGVRAMGDMFYRCRSLTSLDLSGFDASKISECSDMDTAFYYCDSLERVNSVVNAKFAVLLPTASGGYWIREDTGEKISETPIGLARSITLVRKFGAGEEAPAAPADAYITVTKEKTSYICGDILNTNDLTVTYFDSTGAASQVYDYTTNADEIDMSAAGTKELTVTYEELTASVNIYVTSGNKEGIKIDFADPDKTYIYTGKALTPKIKVTNNGEPLTEGTDYTVKYSNNVKASESAKIVVTGKGNLFKSHTKVFTIQRKQLDNTDLLNGDVTSDGTAYPRVEGDYVTVVEGAKISPVLMYNGMKLTAKDFKVPDEYKSYKWKLEDNDKPITVTGQGNYEGARTLAVKVISKAEQKNVKLIVNVGKDAKQIPYDGEPKDIAALGLLTVSTKNTPAPELKEAKNGEDGDYVIYYPADITSAGTKKFTVTGISERCIGTVTKSFTIKPKKTEFVVEYDTDNKGYDFVSTGTTIPDNELIVRDPLFIDGAPLIKDKDYKVSYSGNKKAGTAKFTITGLGSYKGGKCTKTFTINKGVLNNNAKSTVERTKNLEIAVADKVFNKAAVYKSAPYVSIDGVQLKASNYTVTYYLDNPAVNSNPRVMDGKNKVTKGETTVWVKIVGKGNYANEDNTCYATASYRVRSKGGSDSYDLSKAKIAFQDNDGTAIKKIEYTGEPITRDDIKVVVTYKIGKDTYTLSETNDYTVTFINNVNKGKAVVLITGRPGQSSYVGSKTASFSITAGNLSNIAG